MLKRGHFLLTKQGRFGATPQIPHKITGYSLIRVGFREKISALHHLIHKIHQSFSRIWNTIKYNIIKTSILLQWNAAMIQQVIVAALVHTSMGIQELNMLVKKTTVAKGHFQGLQQFCFLFR